MSYKITKDALKEALGEKLPEIWQSGGAGRETIFSRGNATFREYSGNPLIGPSGKSGDWREFGVSGPLVVLNPEDGKYYMLCRGFSGARWDIQGSIPQIGLFISEDGLHWEEYSANPVIPRGESGEFDEMGCNTTGGTLVYVPWVEGRWLQKWLLYYWGIDANGVRRIGVAESDDLKTWTKRPENPIISTRAASGNVRCCGVFYRLAPKPYFTAVVLDDGRRAELGAGLPLEIYTSNDGVTWTFNREQVFAPDASDVYRQNIYPHVPEIYSAMKLLDHFAIFYEGESDIRGQYFIGALASYDGLHWFQVPKPIYQEIGYGQRSPVWHTLHPYLILGRDGAFLYHANSYWHKDEGYVEWIEVAFIDPKWLLEVLTSQGVNYIWDSESVTANTYGYSYINALNYARKTLYFTANASGDLTIEVDPNGSGNWYVLDTKTGITNLVYHTTHDFTYMRIKFSVDATITAKVVYAR